MPEQAVSQHTPSTQLPLEHCEADEQALPLPWSDWQLLSELRQYAAATQVVSEAHVVAHALPEQVYGEHAVTFEGLQAPNPSHE